MPWREIATSVCRPVATTTPANLLTCVTWLRSFLDILGKLPRKNWPSGEKVLAGLGPPPESQWRPPESQGRKEWQGQFHHPHKMLAECCSSTTARISAR